MAPPPTQHTRPAERTPVDPTTQRFLVEAGETIGHPAKEYVNGWITRHGYRGWGDFLEHGGRDAGLLLTDLQREHKVYQRLPA